MTYLSKATELLVKLFPNNWEKSVDDFTIEYDTIVIENIYDNLNFSILSGEYILDFEFKDKLELFRSRLLKFIELLNIHSNSKIDILEVIEISNYLGLFDELKNSIDKYIEFILNIYRKFDFSSKLFIYKYDSLSIKNRPEPKYVQLFYINIRIAEYDHFYNREDIDQLSEISRRLRQDLYIKPYSTLLRRKCDYLINKLLLRIRLDSKLTHEDRPKPVYITNNDKEVLVETNQFRNSLTKEWLNYINIHYEFDPDWKILKQNEYDELKGKNLKNYKLFELHKLIKYHKDVNPIFSSSLHSISEIRKEIKSRLDSVSSNNPFLKYTLLIDYNYALNNEFSKLCEDKNSNSTLNDVEKLYQEIVNAEQISGIRNFFPQTKYLSFLIKELEKTYQKRQAVDLVEKCREIIDKCHELYKRYEESINWSRDNYPYVYQSPIEDCIQENKEGEKLFVFSSFLLPLTKRKYVEEFNFNQSKVAEYETSIRVLENLDSRLGTLKDLKNKVEDSNKRTIEIVGVFTAIISFVAASLPTYKFIETPLEAALFMLALSTSLAVFVLLLLVAFRGKTAYNDNKVKIYWGGGVATLLWIGIVIGPKLTPFLKTFVSTKPQEQSQESTNTISNQVIVAPTDINSQTTPSRTITNSPPSKPKCDCPSDSLKNKTK